jgi:DNA-binding NarL/FixJ family response regulator
MRILLVDDHAVVRRGLRQILADGLPGATFGEASSAAEALDAVGRAEWDLVVLDISMPGRGGMDALKDIRGLRPRLPALVLSVHAEDQYALRAFRAGASGYLTKDSAPDQLVGAARKILEGGRYVTPAVAEQLAARLDADGGRPPHEQLSDRELQVLRMIGGGKSVKEIGGELHLSEKTVSTYRTRVLEKLQLRTSADLIRYALHNGLVE